MKKKNNGFSLIEVLIVLVIIAILALLATPSTTSLANRKKVAEAIELAKEITPYVKSFYILSGTFPKNNEEASLPDPEKLIGNFTSNTQIKDGAIHITLGQKAPSSLQGEIVTLQPVYIKDSPTAPISWICGYSTGPEGMTAAGENKTSLPNKYLPVSCRGSNAES